jgi:hypothetical protein
MSHPCPLMLDVLCPMKYYNTPTGVPDAEGPDNVEQEQRRLAESLVEGVEVEGEVQQKQAQFQPQIKEVSHDDWRGRGMSYIRSRRAAEIPLFLE